MKIVGLVAARNEDRIITQCLRTLSFYTDSIVFLDDCSEDNTLNLVRDISEYCRIERIISKEKWDRNEPLDRNLLLDTGREVGGTHFVVLDADEVITSNCLVDNFLKNHILSLQLGDRLYLNWIELWRSTEQYRFDESVWTWNYKDFIFCDDRICSYESDFIHTSRTPNNLKGHKYTLEGYEHGVMHFQCVNWRNLLVKQAWYKCLEKVNDPQKTPKIINEKYAIYEDNLALQPCLKECFFQYESFDKSVYQISNPFYEKQVMKWFKLLGINYFIDLAIWNVDWIISDHNLQIIGDV